MRVLTILRLLVFAVLLPVPALAQSGPRNCSTVTQNLYVRDVLDEYYFWYRELPRVNASNYASPEAYLEAVRYRPLDTTFSYITSRAANEAFYGDSQFVGLGISTQASETDIRILQVFPESPASEAGLGRGDRITEINGRTRRRPDRVGRDRQRVRRQRDRRHGEHRRSARAAAMNGAPRSPSGWSPFRRSRSRERFRSTAALWATCCSATSSSRPSTR